MPIHLVTGLPGNAKTLRAIQMLIKRAKEENRAVYYAGLKEFKEDDPRLEGTQWKQFDPTRWHEDIPPGALCFVDEAQKVFRSRTLGSVPPKHVTELEEHRHKGLDFVFVTQHPSLIDPAIRKLTQIHEHQVRIWGMEASTIHRWEGGVKDNCDKPSARVDSEKTKWGFAKDLYGLYKSADVHTVKRRLPGRVKLLAGLVVTLIALVWFGYHTITKKIIHKGVDQVDTAAPGGGQASPGPGIVPSVYQVKSGAADPVAEAKEYLWNQTPRVEALPQTAPKYDQLTTPTHVPVPAMCIQKGVPGKSKEISCKCFTQQATPMPSVPLGMCMEFARNGYFQDFDADKDRAAVERTQASANVMSTRQDVPPPVRQVQDGPQGVVIPGLPSGPGRTDKSGPMVVEGVIQDGPPNNRATRAAVGSGA